MNYIVLDLEASCWNRPEKKQNETIEIGALKINSQKEIISEFQRFIKPIKFPILSEFCTELTSITQAQVDQAKHYYEVIQEFKEWIGYPNQDYYLCSWGFYDKKQFESDDRLNGLPSDWLQNHISIKHQHKEVRQLQRPMGMKGALKLEGFPLDGTHHRGIDDARNITKIFLKYFDQWEY